MEEIKHFHQPTIDESLGNGWYTMKKYFLYLLVAIFINGLFQGGMRYTFSNDRPNKEWKWNDNWTLKKFSGPGFLRYNLEPDSFSWPRTGLPFFALFTGLFGIAIAIFIKPVFSYGAGMMFVEAVRDIKPEIGWLIRGFQNNYLNIVLANLMKTAIVVMGFFLLIVPGIIFACRLAFVQYLVMDKQMDAIKALEVSWRMTRGYGWTLFGMGIVSIFIFIVGLLCLFVGVFPAIIWIGASFASMYQSILTNNSNYTDEIPYNYSI